MLDRSSGKGEHNNMLINDDTIGLNDPDNKTFVEGDATYIFGAPATYFLPVVEDARLRPLVESACTRPMGEAPAPGAP